MGVDMEIELIAGLSKPKIELTALPTLTSPDVSEADIPDFTALLSDDVPDDSTLAEPAPMLDPRVQVSVAMPPEKSVKQEPKKASNADAPVSLELNTKVEPINTPDIQIGVVQAAIAQLEMKAEPAVVNQPTPAVKATTETDVAIFTQPRLAKAPPKVVAIPTEKSAPPAAISQAIIADTTVELAAPNAPKQQPTLNVFTAQNLPLPIESPVKALPDVTPQMNIEDHPVQTSPKIAPQLQAQPAAQPSFSNLETVINDPAEVQFSIKIERQTVDIAQPSRASAPTAPVANQITAQLPQLLTKAEKQTIELRLDPPELGRVTIHLTTNDQHVTAQVVAERADTIDLMRRHAELLTATLARAGFSQADLSFQQGQGQNDKAEFEQFQGITGEFESDEPAVAAPTLTGQDGRLDIRL